MKLGDLVRVVYDCMHMPGQKWQYGKVRWVYHRLLVDINFDGGTEVARGLPVYAHEIRRL